MCVCGVGGVEGLFEQKMLLFSFKLILLENCACLDNVPSYLNRSYPCIILISGALNTSGSFLSVLPYSGPHKRAA